LQVVVLGSTRKLSESDDLLDKFMLQKRDVHHLPRLELQGHGSHNKCQKCIKESGGETTAGWVGNIQLVKGAGASKFIAFQ
jgi:hypothetical protein